MKSKSTPDRGESTTVVILGSILAFVLVVPLLPES